MDKIDKLVDQLLEAEIDTTISVSDWEELNAKIVPAIARGLHIQSKDWHNSVDRIYVEFIYPSVIKYVNTHHPKEVKTKTGGQIHTYAVDNGIIDRIFKDYSDKLRASAELLFRHEMFLGLYQAFTGTKQKVRSIDDPKINKYNIKSGKGDFAAWFDKNKDVIGDWLWHECFSVAVGHVIEDKIDELKRQKELEKHPIVSVDEPTTWDGEMSSDGGSVSKHGTYKNNPATAYVHAIISATLTGWGAYIFAGHLTLDQCDDENFKKKTLWSDEHYWDAYADEDEDERDDEGDTPFQTDTGEAAWEIVGGPGEF